MQITFVTLHRASKGRRENLKPIRSKPHSSVFQIGMEAVVHKLEVRKIKENLRKQKADLFDMQGEEPKQKKNNNKDPGRI